MTIEVGKQAPDFTTVNEANEKITLSNFKGKKIVLIFYPFDFSGLCQGELCEVRDNYNEWIDKGAIVFGISRDSRHAHAAFKKQENFPFSLLADTKGEIAKLYGAWNEAFAAAERMTLVINENGQIVFKIHNGIPDARDHSGVLAAINN
jgi:peroxiredoxin